MSNIQRLRDFIFEKGFNFEPVIDNQFHGYKPGDKEKFWFIGSEIDGNITFTFGNWRSGEKYHFNTFKNGDSLVGEKLSLEHQKLILEEKKKIAKERKEVQEKMALFAKSELEKPDLNIGLHPYFLKKGFESNHGIKVIKDRFSRITLAIPLIDKENKIWSIQYINTEGEKRFIRGGKTAECFYRINATTETETIYLCEGIATGISINLATGSEVLVCFYAKNLVKIANLFKYDEKSYCVCGDDDFETEKNPGKASAIEAAKILKAKIVFPQFKDRKSGQTDFNDLHLAENINVLKNQILNLPVKIENQIVSRFDSVPEPIRADQILDRLGNVIKTNGDFFIWDKTHWKKLCSETFKSQIYNSANWSYENSATHKTVKSLFNTIIAKIPVAPEKNNLFSPSAFLFNFKDGTYSVERNEWNEYVLKRHDHNPEDYLSYCSPYRLYGENNLPKNGAFNEYLAIRKKDTGEDGIRVLKEMLAAALIPYAPRIFFLVGKSNSGKSTFAWFMKELCGNGNWASVDPSDQGNFAWEPAIGKLLNICLELDRTKPIKDSLIKKIRDRMPMVIDRKGIKNVMACLPPVHIYCANEMPSSLEGHSGALDNRMTMLNFDVTEKNQFSEVADLGAYIWKHDSGHIFEAAREGLESLIKNNFQYFIPDSSKSAVKDWQINSDTVMQFLRDVKEEDFEMRYPPVEGFSSNLNWNKGADSEGFQKASDIYWNFKEWCSVTGHRFVMSRNRFYRELIERFKFKNKMRTEHGKKIQWEPALWNFF